MVACTLPAIRAVSSLVREPAYRWPEKRQRQHFEAHVKQAAKDAARVARQRARDARRLAAQLRRENDRAYGPGGERAT